MTRSSQKAIPAPRSGTECPPWCAYSSPDEHDRPDSHCTSLIDLNDLVVDLRSDEDGTWIDVDVRVSGSGYRLDSQTPETLFAMGLALTEAAQRLRLIAQIEAVR